MLNDVFVKNYPAPPFDLAEIARYAGYKSVDERARALIEECVKESENAFSCRVCYRTFTSKDALAYFGGEEAGKLLKRRLENAEYAVAFAATVGLGIDRLILRYGELSPVKALVFQAIGAERIESLCNVFCAEIKAECVKRGYTAFPRFSAGYGDFSLQAQEKFFASLDCARKIGLSLNGSLLMSPSKSVTALVPVGKAAREGAENCAACGKADCAFRKTEKRV